MPGGTRLRRTHCRSVIKACSATYRKPILQRGARPSDAYWFKFIARITRHWARPNDRGQGGLNPLGCFHLGHPSAPTPDVGGVDRERCAFWFGYSDQRLARWLWLQPATNPADQGAERGNLDNESYSLTGLSTAPLCGLTGKRRLRLVSGRSSLRTDALVTISRTGSSTPVMFRPCVRPSGLMKISPRIRPPIPIRHDSGFGRTLYYGNARGLSGWTGLPVGDAYK